MKKTFIWFVTLMLVSLLFSCQTGNTSTDSIEESNALLDAKSVLDMTDEELKTLYDDLTVLNLTENTGELNAVIELELKQTGMTETFKLMVDEKSSIRPDGTIKRSYYQNLVGYQLDEKAEYIFSDGMAYIYSQNGKFKAVCSPDEFNEYLYDDDDEKVELDYSMKAIEATEEYVIIESEIHITDNSIKFVRDYFEGIIPMLIGIEEFDDFTLVSAVQKTKIVGDFIEKIDDEYIARFVANETEYEVKMIGVGEYSEKDPIITIPENDDIYFEIPKINAISDFAKAIDDFYNDEFISFTQKCDFKITSENEDIAETTTDNVWIIHPDGKLKFKIVSDLVSQDQESQTMITYDGVKYEASYEDKKESFIVSQDEAYGALAEYYAMFMMVDVNDLESATLENDILKFKMSLSDEMFDGIAYSLIYTIFTDPSYVLLDETVRKDVFFDIKGSELIRGSYDIEFTCSLDNETYTVVVSLELDNINQIDESTNELDI